jgi:hypothetical protein
MKKIIVVFLLFVVSKSYSQLLNCNSTGFTGIAPAPWAIDGSIQDWETILGISTSNPEFPFGNISTPYDTYGANDPDNPEPKIDLRVKSVAYDDYNVYFYFRRLDNSNSAVKAFYFLDTNVDGFISSGEPVIIINFNSQKVQKLSLGYYVPLNPNGDPIGEPFPGFVCRIDGFPMKGTVDEAISSNKADLLPNEIFAAAVTENGYGVELAVPFRLISQYKYFSYHLSLQKGGGSYQPNAPSDNAGGCGSRLNVIGEPDIEVSAINVSTITPGLSYKVDVTFNNLTPAEVRVTPSGIISFKDIVQNGNLPIDETQFSVSIGGTPYSYYTGSFSDQPIQYSSILTAAGVFYLQPFASKTVSIIISFPSNHSVQSAVVEIQPFSRFKLEEECFPNTGGGGKPINPVGFTLGEEEEPTRSNSNSAAVEKIDKDRNIMIYPNPSKGNTNVILPANEGSFEITLTDYTGKLVKKWSNIKQGIFKVENLMAGFYILTVRSGNGKISTSRKLLVN